jgi:hypothetical protein
VPSVSASANTITLADHGFETGDPVTFRAEAGGSLPAPLAEGTTYYAIAVTDSTFSVAASGGGAAVDITSAGSNVVVIAPLPIAAAIEWASRIVDDMLPAHVLPLDVVPAIVEMTTAELAAGKLARRSGAASKSLTEIVDAADKRLKRWAEGIPLRDGSGTPAPANKATSATVPYADRRGWNRYGGI